MKFEDLRVKTKAYLILLRKQSPHPTLPSVSVNWGFTGLRKRNFIVRTDTNFW